ncbi:MAG: immunoglobulin domain-containing protein [Planctomycetes bacterium]|nr:immunoglobulin domain-containing protein [Planctomycetota bacterium]
MASFDPDGEGPEQAALAVAGKFTEINGQPAINIAQWDGIGWSSVGGGLNGNFYKLAVFDEDGDGPDPARLFVGFQPLTSVGITGLGRWDGKSWSAVGSISIEEVSAMTVADLDGAGPEAESLLVAAWFREEGVPYQGNRLAKWNGKFWSFFPSFYIPYGRIMSIVAMDEDGDGPEPVKIYVSGDVRTSDNYSDNGAAVWDGSAWRTLGGGMRSMAWSFTDSIVYDEDGPSGNPPSVIFGGAITSAGDLTATGIARWGRLAPTIHQHPTSRTVDRGASVQFYVQAGSGDAVSYQWRKNGRPFRDDARVTGSCTDTLRLSQVKLYDAGSYDVVVTNSCGTTESLQAQLTIRGAASIIQAE